MPGTIVSRMSGYVRSILLAAALGNLLHADIFTIANTIPNMLYILLAGGVFNAVLVPQLVRSMKNDADGGSAYDQPDVAEPAEGRHLAQAQRGDHLGCQVDFTANLHEVYRRLGRPCEVSTE